MNVVKVTTRCWCGAELVEDKTVTAGVTCPRARLGILHGRPGQAFTVVMSVLLFALAGCASFGDGSGQNSKWGHQATYAESCKYESGGCPTLRSRLAKVPGLGWLFRPVGLGPCLPTTDDGQPQPCGGWPVLAPGAHAVAPQQKAPPLPPERAETPLGVTGAGAPSAASMGKIPLPTGSIPRSAPSPTPAGPFAVGTDCDSAPCLVSTAELTKHRLTFPEALLWLLSRETYHVVIDGRSP